MKAIMYHYVRPFDANYPYLKNLDFEDFKNQLDFFEKEFGFVSQADFIKSIETGVPKSGVVLTFDDGLSCHYNFVFHELKKRNLWGIFYIPTQPYVEGKMIDVHRIHLLLARFDSQVIFDYLDKKIKSDQYDVSRIDEFRQLTYKTQKNDEYTLLVKRILNYFIAYKHREAVIDSLMTKFIKNEKDLLLDFYLNKKQICEMHNNKMIIGSHTINHPVMSRLDKNQQTTQINQSFEYLKNILGDFNQKTFCYPYGGFHSFTNETVKILENENCLYSFNVEHRDINEEDLILRRQALPRYDCNFFPFGSVREHILQ